MREIIFRGKRTDNGEWVDGAVYKIPRSEGLICIIFLDWSGWRKYAVDPETVGQYTGLKDKHGKMIFEGDILRQKSNGVYGLPFSVVFDDGSFMWNENGRRDLLYQRICDACEVIGNIHDRITEENDG